MADDHTTHDGAIRYMSDGIEIELANGDVVRPQLRDPETEEDWFANAVWSVDGYAAYGPDPDNREAYLWFDTDA